ncbi:MAG: 50S ribosomal protein L23 [Elusimicrobia bacterium]|nr:50S ribosomal protein L23 [Elusimicrobiota bacterium]
MDMDLQRVLIRPLITERSTALKEAANQYCFQVHAHATKGQIRQAVEALFNVAVTGVNTAILPGKFRRLGAGRPGGYRADWKKAIVTIRRGQEIKLVEEPK